MKTVNITTVNKVLHHHKVTVRYLRMQRKNWLSPTEQKLFKKHFGNISNELKSKVEVYQLKHNKYDTYDAYVSNNLITTFMGDVLGTIITRNRNNTKDYLTVKLLNNEIYKGYYYHKSGDYCVLKRVIKNKKAK